MDLETTKVDWTAPAVLYVNPDALEQGFGWAERKNTDLAVAVGMFVRSSLRYQQGTSIGIELTAIEGCSKGTLGAEEIWKLYRRPDFPKEEVDQFLDD
jgi:hypothetical protein